MIETDPLAALAARDGALALITGIDGPSYRPLGATMALFDDARVGALSSGCIEEDIAVQARDATAPLRLRYGQGSRAMDLVLPCGGGLDVLVLPKVDRAALAQATAELSARRDVTLRIDPQSGALTRAEAHPTGWHDGAFYLHRRPELRFHIYGKGPEAVTFARLVHAAGYPALLLSPDPDTRVQAEALGCTTRPLTRHGPPADVTSDARTAVTLFFHDHEWEPPLLAHLLPQPALYIGAQGSQRAAATRRAALEELTGAPASAHLKGPIGLIPSTRDPRVLAVSVLAEILEADAAS